MSATTIIVQPPGSYLQQFGSEIAANIWPEDVRSVHDEHGPLSATFKLNRRGAIQWPDLEPFTPVWIMENGQVSWSGRIRETPAVVGGGDDQIAVVAEGWQFHGKDDVVQKTFVSNDLQAWRDIRVYSDTNVNTEFTTAYDITQNDGATVMGVPQGKTAAAATAAAIVFDAGPFSTIKRVVITYKGGGAAGFRLDVGGGDTTPNTVPEFVTVAAAPLATVTTNVATTFTTARRFVRIQLTCAAGAAGSSTAWVQIQNVQLFADTTYESGNASIFKASQGYAALLTSCPFWNSDTSLISTTTFNIPHFSGPMSGIVDYLDALNAFHLYQWKIQDDPNLSLPRLRFRPIPSDPLLVARPGEGIEFSDASRNDGSDVYNRVVVEYTDAAGNASQEARLTATLPNAIADPDIVVDSLAANQIPFADFETVGSPPTGFGIGGGTGFTRDTVTFDSGVASGLCTSNASGAWNFFTSAASCLAGRRYRIQYRIRKLAAWTTGGVTVTVSGSTTFGTDTYTAASLTASTWTTKTIEFTALENSFLVAFASNGAAPISTAIFNIDNIQVFEAHPTIVDKQGFVRTRVLSTGLRLTAAAADQIGDVFLQAHRTTPLRGSLKVSGAALRFLVGDATLPAYLIGRYVGDGVLIDEIDPDTGALGRLGIISGVELDHETMEAMVTIDARNDFVDALDARYSVFQTAAS